MSEKRGAHGSKNARVDKARSGPHQQTRRRKVVGELYIHPISGRLNGTMTRHYSEGRPRDATGESPALLGTPNSRAILRTGLTMRYREPLTSL